MAGHEWEDWFEREEFIGQISDIRVQNLQVEREVVQKRTFTRWMNLHLEKCDPPIEVHDLFRDIQDGRILMALLEELSGCKLLHGFKKSSHRIFRLNNIAKVLSFLEERNVKLVSIDAVDVADGNSSIILGLIWNIILFFQIKELTGNIRSQFPSSSSLSSIPTSSDSDASYNSTPSDERQSASTAMREHSKAIKKLLQWVQKRTRKYSVAVKDFGKSWTSGLAFLAVIKSIDPSLVDMRKALLRSAKENLEDAFRIAHYSLGIPRLLEPEDVTIKAPDEQSIMTYVSQFLEHFPGIEEPEEPCKLIERSLSMGRINFRDPDFNHTSNGSYRSRVRERSYMFQKDCTQPPPKILISSVSVDRGVMSPPFRPAASRSWSTEDFLADSPHMDDNSSSVVDDPKEPASEVLPISISNSPELSYAHSPTDSSVPESVMGDSAISSPDSWVESEYGVMPERFSVSRSDSSLCDSGTAWDVYRATPVEVTTLDEGFVPSIVDRVSEDQSVTESYIDEGIYSLSSLESTQERIQGHTEKNQEDKQEEKKKEANLENRNQDLSLEQVSGENKAELTKEVDSKQIDTILPQKDKVPREQEPSFGLCDAEELSNTSVGDLLETDQTNQPSPEHIEELVEQNSVEASTYRVPECLKEAVDVTGDAQDCEGLFNGQTDGLRERNHSEKVEAKSERQKNDSSLKSRDDSEIVKERDEGVEETQSEASEGVLRGFPDPQENISTETCDALANTHPTNQGRESIPSSDSCMGRNIPLIAISSEPEDQDTEKTFGPEGKDHAGDEDVPQPETTGSKGADTDVNSPETPDERSCESNEKDDSNLPGILPCLISETVHAIASEQITDVECGHLDETDEHDEPNTIDKMEIREAKQESPHHDSQTGDTNKDFAQSLSTDAEAHPVNTEQDIDSTNQREGQQYKQGDTIPVNMIASTQQNTDPDNVQPNGKIGALCLEPAAVSRDMDLFYTDRSSPTEDLVGDLMEPMDLFYPDKEEPMFTEPLDNEMQSWPSVLSVSALQPAPASETLPDKPLNLLEEDLRNLLQEQDQVITKPNQEADKASEPQEQCAFPGEKMGGLRAGDVPVEGSDLNEPQLQSSAGSARENTEPVRCDTKSSGRQEESQIPPVLRHRKGVRFTEATDNQTAVTASTRKADNADSDCWWSNSWEPYLLLLLWLLLYCFWLLPQLDLKSLPSLLLNLNH